MARGFLLFVAVAITFAPSSLAGDWLQWGGPNGDFTVATDGLADGWPDEGPPLLWKRPLGDGFSSILFDEGRLYTMYRIAEEEAAHRDCVVEGDDPHLKDGGHRAQPFPGQDIGRRGRGRAVGRLSWHGGLLPPTGSLPQILHCQVYLGTPEGIRRAVMRFQLRPVRVTSHRVHSG